MIQRARSVAGAQELTFETQYLAAISLVTAILFGNTFAFSFDRQRQIIQEMAEEVFALELLLQELFIDIPEPHLRWRVIKNIKCASNASSAPTSLMPARCVLSHWCSAATWRGQACSPQGRAFLHKLLGHAALALACWHVEPCNAGSGCVHQMGASAACSSEAEAVCRRHAGQGASCMHVQAVHRSRDTGARHRLAVPCGWCDRRPL
jgi:hypothetical protein